MGELAPDGRPDLRHFLGGAEAVEPRHQRGVQACGDCQSRGRNRRNRAPGCALALRLQHRLRHLLHEQGNAVGALDDVLPSHSLVAPCCRQGASIMAADSRSPSRLSVRLVTCDCPTHGAVELGAESHDKQHRKSFEFGLPSDRTLPGSSGRSNAHPRRSSAPDSAEPALPSVKRALPAFSVGAARGSDQARDSVRRSAATASRQIVPRPASEVEVCASTASSLSSFACAVSSCTNPAARSIWPMIG